MSSDDASFNKWARVCVRFDNHDVFAYWQPAIGASEGNLNIKYISELLVIMIFLFQGSRLKIENLSLLFRGRSSLLLQAGIIFLPVLWVKIGWALGLVPQAWYGPLFF